MSRRLVVAAAIATVGTAVVRSGLAVRAIRSLDRRGGLSSSRAERAYAGVAGVFGALHRRAAFDVRAAVSAGARDIVDLGSGPGDLLASVGVLADASLVGVEPSPAMRAIAAARGVLELDGRAESLPLEASSVDLVVSTLSMHHWEDPAAALRELDRVLRDGGEARIYDVRFAAYSRRELASLASRAGIDPARLRRTVLPERLGIFRPYVLITLAAG
ncbi:MAG: class I SAM-dependent methyltransferase [Candidatus Limnocylindrales bacterium]